MTTPPENPWATPSDGADDNPYRPPAPQPPQPTADPPPAYGAQPGPAQPPSAEQPAAGGQGYGPPAGGPGYGYQPDPYSSGYPAPGYVPIAPRHPSATTSLVLGLVGLIGIATCCGITLVVSPFAWFMGGKAVKEIDASGQQVGGRDHAQAGRILGIIGTVLLVLALLGGVGSLAIGIATGDFN
ncbi:MAG: DUF4190 domain-containing protein [Nocardioides sp.]